MTTPEDLTEQGTAILAVLAQCTVDGQSRSNSWARDRSGLGGIEFANAVKHLIDSDLLKQEEGHADQLVVTKEGWAFVQDHAEHFEGIAKALTRCRNEVDREAASQRSSWTVRKSLLGAAILLVVLTLATAGAAWRISGTPQSIPTADIMASRLDVLKWLYMAGLVATIGLVVIGNTFAKMNRGIRQQNLKAIGITLIAVLVVILALRHESIVEAAIGLLSAIAGYLFGKDLSSDDETTGTSATG